MNAILGLFIFVFGVLQIILFFKIWVMTNNVGKMTLCLEQMLDMFVKKEKLKNNIEDDNLEASIKPENIGFGVGDLVVDKNDNQWRVVEINYPIIICKNSTRGIVEFHKDDLKRF